MYRTDNETHSIDTRGGSLTLCCESSIYSVGATCLDPCTRTNYNRALDWIPLIIGNQSGPPSHPGVDVICRGDLVSVDCASTPQVVIKTPCFIGQ